MGTSVIPRFDMILTGKSIYGIVFMIQGHLQGQNVNSKVKNKKSFLTNINSSEFNIFLGVILTG